MENNNFHSFPVRIIEENINNLPHYRKKKRKMKTTVIF